MVDSNFESFKTQNQFCCSMHTVNWWYAYTMSGPLWQLDLQLHMQSVLIPTDVVSSNLDQGEVYNIMW